MVNGFDMFVFFFFTFVFNALIVTLILNLAIYHLNFTPKQTSASNCECFVGLLL